MTLGLENEDRRPPWLPVPFFQIIVYYLSKIGSSNVCRRLTIDLENEDKEATLEDLMKDNGAYLQTELPRVSPLHKGRPYRSVLALPNMLSGSWRLEATLRSGPLAKLV